ncbi:MAG: hypothetical protein KDA24_27770, partial [Deltaproteobacteria bacterium]|nr:hypothetical protein [Deltaproteobacteria bacterium]
MRYLVILAVALATLLPSSSPAQIALPGLTDGGLEIPVSDTPGDRLVRELTAQEVGISGRIDRMQGRTRFFVERLDIRSRDLRELEERYANRRADLGRRGPARQKAIADVLEELREVREHIGRIEEVWIGQLDQLATNQTKAGRLLVRVERSKGEAAVSASEPEVNAHIDRIDPQLLTTIDERDGLRNALADAEGQIASLELTVQSLRTASFKMKDL